MNERICIFFTKPFKFFIYDYTGMSLKTKGFYIILSLAIFSFFINIQFISSEPSDSWQIQPGTIYTFHVSHHDSSMPSIIDSFASSYHFNNLSTDFFGDPQIKVNLTAIDYSANLSSIIDSFLHLRAPFNCSQLNGDKWETCNTYFLPLCVPIDNWDAIETLFSEKGDVEVEHSFVGEYSYKINWMKGLINYSYTYVWDDKDGSLQALICRISSLGLYDEMDLRLAGIGANDSSLINILLPLGGVFISIGITLIFVLVKKKSKEKKSPSDLREDYPSETAQMLELQENQQKFVERYKEFKKHYLIRWSFIQIILIGVMILGANTLEEIGTSASQEKNITLTFIAGGLVLFLLTMFLNIPLIIISNVFRKEDKRLFKQNNPNVSKQEKWKKILFKKRKSIDFTDMSPMFTVATFFAIFLLRGLFTNLPTTLQGKILLIGLAVLLIILLAAGIYLMPFVLLKRVRKEAVKRKFFFDL